MASIHGNATFRGESKLAGAATHAKFEDSAINEGTVDQISEFKDNSINNGTISLGFFYNSAANAGGAYYGCVFADASVNLVSANAGDATFVHNSMNQGKAYAAYFSDNTINAGEVAEASFDLSACNQGLVKFSGSFSNCATNYGSAGMGVFSEFAVNSGVLFDDSKFFNASINAGIVQGDCLLVDTAINQGIIEGDADLTSSASNMGTVSGVLSSIALSEDAVLWDYLDLGCVWVDLTSNIF